MASGDDSTAETVDPSAAVARGRIFLAGGMIVAAGLAAYWNSLGCPFVFDDMPAIVNNPTIRHLWPLGNVLAPPSGGGGVSGRPLLNLSLAANYAAGGLAVQGYHAVNLVLHVLVGLTMFGVVRRTLRLRSGQALVAVGRGHRTPPQDIGTAAFGDAAPQFDALLLALAAALLWTVHPLLTESVTAVVNRAEVLAAWFYLLTLYGFVRSVVSRSPRRWHALSVGACLLGMASKEWMVSAPLIVLLHDRTFVAGSFRAAWRWRRGYYLGLAGTWAVLVLFMLGSHHRNETVGFGLGVSAWSYALTQCFAIMHYLRLAVWPQPLVLDYGMYLVKSPLVVAPQALALGLLGAGTAIALWRRPAAGFLGASFFALLAPSSSLVPLITQTVAEHHMYLPLAVVIVAAVLALHAATGRRSLAVFLVVAVALGGLTARRNQDYRSEFAIWNDTAAKWPDNARVQLRLGILLFDSGRVEEAIARYRRALQAEPHNPDALSSLGHALLQTGRVPEAIDCYDQVLRLRPDSAEVHNNLGNALTRTGRLAEAAAHYAEAIRLKPDYDKPHNNLGIVLLQTGRAAEAAAQFEAALRLNPDFADAHLNLGNLLMQAGRPAEAIAQYELALRIQPDLAEARGNLGYALAREGRIGEAIRQYEALVRLEPDNAEARRMLARMQALPPGER